ncbi:hypothetical protein BDY19DRAFT_908514 [Irpex rosettiformis]|uniref:Uncharacterized protein n=1 Tax=Irpex rosettiformis TaxID=378272 RepID=A0ACB8TW49_9APHY|nr:hypothetical protein BDY19DRAFT_908514 [Irpex rosettiformis]
MYQSTLEPLPTLGNHGDLWVTRDDIYLKNKFGSWAKWTIRHTYGCPWDKERCLVWSRNAELKYLASKRQEVSLWKKRTERVPMSCISENARAHPAIQAALQKEYKQLDDHDILVLLNARCDTLCSRFETYTTRMHQGMVHQNTSEEQLQADASTSNIDNPGHSQLQQTIVMGCYPDSDSDPKFPEASTLNFGIPDDNRLQQTPVVTGGCADFGREDFGRENSGPESLDKNTFSAGNSDQSQLQRTVEAGSLVDSDPLETNCKPSHQRTYEPFPISTYKTPPDGRECSGHVRVWNNMQMFLPYCEGDPEADPDLLTCRWVAKKSTDATAYPKSCPDDPSPSTSFSSTPTVTVIESPPPGSSFEVMDKHVAKVRRLLSLGLVVAVRNAEQRGPRYEFDEKSVRNFSHREADGARIEWQSAPTTVKGTVKQFFEAASKKKDRVNCLDMPISRSYVPWLIDQLASNIQALSATDGLGLSLNLNDTDATAPEIAQPSRKRPAKSTKTGGGCAKKARATISNAVKTRSTAGDISAHKEASSVTPLPAENLSPTERLKKMLKINHGFGMRFMEWDGLRSASWALLSTSGSHTAYHHDASGYFTFVRCEVGAKLWCFLRPKNHSGEVTSAMESFVDIYESFQDTNNFGDHADPVSIVLTPGTILIQPAEWFHQVYTLENSVFTGGHFLMLDGMHLTEVTRAIAFSILFNYQERVLRKPFISLARMLLWSEVYAPGDVDIYQGKFEYSDESNLELRAARVAVEVVLDYNNIELESIRPKDLDKHEWLAGTEVGADWRDPGEATLSVPDMTRLAYEGYRMSQSYLRAWSIAEQDHRTTTPEEIPGTTRRPSYSTERWITMMVVEFGRRKYKKFKVGSVAKKRRESRAKNTVMAPTFPRFKYDKLEAVIQSRFESYQRVQVNVRNAFDGCEVGEVAVEVVVQLRDDARVDGLDIPMEGVEDLGEMNEVEDVEMGVNDSSATELEDVEMEYLE